MLFTRLGILVAFFQCLKAQPLVRPEIDCKPSLICLDYDFQECRLTSENADFDCAYSLSLVIAAEGICVETHCLLTLADHFNFGCTETNVCYSACFKNDCLTTHKVNSLLQPKIELSFSFFKVVCWYFAVCVLYLMFKVYELITFDSWTSWKVKQHRERMSKDKYHYLLFEEPSFMHTFELSSRAFDALLKR